VAKASFLRDQKSLLKVDIDDIVARLEEIHPSKDEPKQRSPAGLQQSVVSQRKIGGSDQNGGQDSQTGPRKE